MALSPELKRMVSASQASYGLSDPLEVKRAETLARQAANDDEPEEYLPTIREQLALLGLQKATKQELREIIVDALLREPDA